MAHWIEDVNTGAGEERFGEMASATTCNFRANELTKNEPDFVTVVSVGNNQQPSTTADNFVTVLSIGTIDKNHPENDTPPTSVINNSDIHPEEEVQVFRLPGEPLGFGLKFEGGAKNAEKVKRLFVQSCAEQSPASRAKCSWGTIGEGDEVLSIDGVPVTHMSRLDCVRRLKESQLVIKLLVRCRGALRPEVVSAELKSPPKNIVKCEKKIPPELPSVPPPVPPRKLRHARGSGDGEANPIPAKKTWNGSPVSSGSSSLNDSPQSKVNFQIVGSPRNAKTCEDSALKKSPQGSPNTCSKKSPNERSPELSKCKQEPSEAMVYLDARSQDGSSTHGSTSDDTGSSMSTVVDRFSLSDRFSTVSTTSTTSGGGAAEQNGCSDRTIEEITDETFDSRDVTRLPTLEHLEKDFLTNPSEYLLKRLASSEAATHVELRGDAGALVEKITAVVAPNTIIIEETMTLQPPLSFQDAPLSYGHETRPGLVYTADLAADSTTHFRPIRDEASIVECVNGGTANSYRTYETVVSPVAPKLPIRNHVNRIPVNQQKDAAAAIVPETVDNETHHSREVPMPRESIDRVAPILPPKPLPRKDIKLKRKRPPPPPPPPPRREPPPPVPVRTQPEPIIAASPLPNVQAILEKPPEASEKTNPEENSLSSTNTAKTQSLEVEDNEEILLTDSDDRHTPPFDSPSRNDPNVAARTNKVLEIIEMKKNKSFKESIDQMSPSKINDDVNISSSTSPGKNVISVVPAPREKRKSFEKKRDETVSSELEDSEESNSSEIWQEAKENQDSSENVSINLQTANGFDLLDGSARDDSAIGKDGSRSKSGKESNNQGDDDDDETYRSLDEIKEDFKSTESNGTLSESSEDDDERHGICENPEIERDSTSDDSEDNGDDYYWQSNLATIGEEEENSSLEYTNANKDVNNCEDKSSCGDRVESKSETARGCTVEITETMKNGTIGDVTKPECVRRISNETANSLDNKLETQVNGRMENCGGDQRLPPDGDEFPATYQEFSACTSEQYQYVGTSTRLTPRISSSNNNIANNNNNNVVKSSSENLVRNEKDENSSSTILTTSSTSSSTKYTKSFVEKISNESSKTLRVESTTKKISTNDNDDVISSFRESREKSSSYVRANNKTPQSENHSSSQFVTNSPKREIFQKPEVSEREEFTEESKRSNISYANNSKPKICEIPVVVTEKTFEIPNYYSKETKSTEKIGREVESCYDKRDGTREPKICDKNDAEYPESPPPPLPLTGPPKVETPPPASSIGRSIERIGEAPNARKYSLTSDLRRQDDKSEKSVRDKIAMFSSQSSLESPLFPSQSSVASPIATVTTSITSNAKKLSKYKSSDDVFNDEKMSDKREYGNVIERTQSFVDLSDSARKTFNDQTVKENGQRPPSLPKTLPPDETDFPSTKNPPKATIIHSENSANPYVSKSSNQQISSFEFIDVPVKPNANLKPATSLRSTHNDVHAVGSEQKNVFPTEINYNNLRSSQPNLTRATSFSGESSFANDLSQSVNSTVSNNGQISRTNSLASTFKRNNEDMRRQSLNQLIEQRRKGISKLRGLVIPEKNSVPVDKPIIDLPEIKSRDSILLHQLPKSSIQDKWGSQSSLTSNASTASLPMKATTSFKMPAPQIMSKYSPAFKRKSLAVYGTSTSNSSVSNTPTSTARGSPVQGYSGSSVDPPKSLESICSPTRSDYSFEFASSTSVSPETMRNRSRPLQRKIRGDYDDSDNDSAVSSSQSSISRGFSPPTSPVPSERSSLSSERSYHTSLIMDVPARHYSSKETPIRQERMQHLARPVLYNERTYSNSERSSSGSSSCGSPNASSPLPEMNPRNSHIPQRQALKRSSSTETNCSSSSTLTSGSQASAESLSRRVLKPQSVEAINRKNILASARCRSGRDLNGSPLIQRKFSTDEELPISSLAQENGTCHNGTSGFIDRKDVKIAYIEVTEAFDEQRQPNQPTMSPQTRKVTETNVTNREDDSTDSNLMEASNGLKMWVRSEAKALMTETPRPRLEHTKKHCSSLDVPPVARSRALNNTINTIPASVTENWTKNVELEISKDKKIEPCRVQRSSSLTNPKETIVDSINEDLLTTLTTKSRSRAPINLEDRSFGRSSRQMSLEDILVGKKSEEKVFLQSETSSDCSIADSQSIMSPRMKFPPATLPRSINGRPSLGETSWSSEDKSFVSKIPMPEKLSRSIDGVDDSTRLNANSRISKIPTQRTLGRRSTSVTDMKKALERTDSIGATTIVPNNHSSIGSHHRFPSLDSSVEQSVRSTVHEAEKFNGEQFGSISSLASSTSLISQQELAQLVEDANALEDSRGNHEVIVVLLHKENSHGSVGITLAGGVDCEAKEITVHRVLGHSIADKDGRVQRGDRILSINGRSTKGLSHRESLAVLKQPRSEIVLVVSRSRLDDAPRLRSRTESVETIVEGSEMCGTFDETAWGPATRVTIFKDGAGLGFSLAGGRDSPLGDRPLVIKKIFTGGAAEKTASLTAGDQLIEVNGVDVTRMTRIEAWSLMKKLSDGEATLLVRHPATKSS